MPAEVATGERAAIWQRAAPLAAAGWLVVYLLVWASGQRFDASYLDYGWQIVPWDILSDHPLRSVWYLHIQPPLWNLTLGGLAKISPLSDAITLQALQAALGAAGAACAAAIARRCGLVAWGAATVAVVATANPEVLRGAFEPTYELAVSTLLLALVLCLARWAAVPDWRRGPVAIATVGTAVVLTRSLYHPLWLAAIVAAALVSGRRHLDRRQVTAAIAVPVLLVGGWMAKNEVVFGRATMSSWVGMNLQRAVIPVLPQSDLDAMVAAGEVSQVAVVGPFHAYDSYADAMPPCVPSHANPAVAVPTRTTDAFSPNFNDECYLPIFDQAGDDAWAVIRAHPGAVLDGRIWSAKRMFVVSDAPNSSKSFVMRGLDGLYSAARVDRPITFDMTSWSTPIFGSTDLTPSAPIGLSQVVLYLGVGVAGLLEAIRFRRSRDQAWAAVVVAAAFIASWTFVVGIVGELGEQSRFRTMTDPLIWVVGICGLVRWWTRRRATPRTTRS